MLLLSVDWLGRCETDVSDLLPLRVYCSSPGDCEVDNGMMVSTGVTPNSSTRSLWQPPVLSGGPVSRDISGASRTTGEGNENLVYSSPWDCKRSLTCRKILRHGTSGFTSHTKEGVMWILSPLIIHRLVRARTRDVWVQWKAY
jgi:hypothetical protein